jgi:regulator of cell morphogenesis and NO signaling
MQITPDTQVAELATAEPATIRVFQRHHIDFCCGGRLPLAEACALAHVDTDTVLADLRDSVTEDDEGPDPAAGDLAGLIDHIQARYHAPLRDELPRLSAMLDKVVSRHGDRLPDVLHPLQSTFEPLKTELLDHMAKEDRILFPDIVRLERATLSGVPAGWLQRPVSVMEADHEAAGRALAAMRTLTGGYVPPADACPTFRGLYHGLRELEHDMHVHVHLENNVLFPRALALAAEKRKQA